MGDPCAAVPLVAVQACQGGRAALVALGALHGERVGAALPAPRGQAGHPERVARAARRVPAVMAGRAGRCAVARVVRSQDEVPQADPPAGLGLALSPDAPRATARAMSDVLHVAPVPELVTGEEGPRGDAIPERMQASIAPVAIVAIARRRVV